MFRHTGILILLCTCLSLVSMRAQENSVSTSSHCVPVKDISPFERNRSAGVLLLTQYLLFIAFSVIAINQKKPDTYSGKSQQYQHKKYHQLLLHCYCKSILFPFSSVISVVSISIISVSIVVLHLTALPFLSF